MTEQKITAFEISDVEDVRFIIKAKGKHFSLLPKSQDESERDECKQIRIALMTMLLETHIVCNTALEDFKLKP